MVGSRGKGSSSQPKGLAPSESLTVSFDEPANGLLDGEEGENDNSNKKIIQLEEEQTEEINSGSVVGDERDEQGQNAYEGTNMEKDDMTEVNELNVDKTEIVCSQGEMKEESDGGCAATNLIVEDIDKRTNEENFKEDEVLVNTGFDSSDAVDEGKSLEVTTEGLSATSGALDSSDLGITKNITGNLENAEDPSKLNTEETIKTLSNRGEEERITENSGMTNEVKEVTKQLSKPKKKVVKKKVLRKKMVRRQDAVSHEETSIPSEKNDPIVEACKVDTIEDVKHEEKTSNVNDASDEVDETEHLNGEEKLGVKPSMVNQKGRRIKKKMAPQGHSGAAVAKDGQKLPPRDDEPNKLVNDEEKEEVKPPAKVNKKRSRIKKKKAPQGHLGTVTAKDDQKLPSGNDESGSKDHIAITEPDVKTETVEKSGDGMSVSNKSKKKKADKGSVEVVAEDSEKPKPSSEGKRKRVDSMGMIFMCSSETKKDCFEYRVLGLPASKKDMVLRVYKGMRIFLFDVDLRMMYGIYKAAGPGGYNIEPKAFKSQYPSQVRFTILEDCVPLAEERFKQVIKDNYYTKNKFNCQLNSAQVRNLCKLFHESRKKAESTKISGKKKRKAAATTSSAQRDKKRKRVEDNRSRATSSLEQERSRRRSHKDPRHAPVVIDDRYHGRPIYKRETYVPSVAPVTYQPVTAVSPRSRTYSYDRTFGADHYRRDEILDRDHYRREVLVLDRDSFRREIPVLDDDHYRRNPVLVHDLYRRESVVDHRDLGPSSSRESRVPVERSHHEPYASYREVREPRFYSRPAYSTSTKREHYDYTSRGQYAAEYYRPADDRPAPPLYRRY